MAVSFDDEDYGFFTIESQRSVPAPFLTKTYHLVDDSSTNDIISWGDDNTTFVVWCPPEFARDLLPKYFKHNNFSSFVRQLNTYGFRKSVPDRWEFANEFFKKGEKHLLSEIHRRKTSHSAPASKSSFSSVSFQEQVTWSALSTSFMNGSTGEPGNCNNAIVYLTDENDRLRKDNSILLSELFRLRKLYNDVLLFVQQNEKLSPLEYSSQSSSATRGPALLEGISIPRKKIVLETESPDQSHTNKDASCILTSIDSSVFTALDSRIAHSESMEIVKALSVPAADDKLSEEDEAAKEDRAGSALIKLFGVLLPGRKRSHPEIRIDNAVCVTD